MESVQLFILCTQFVNVSSVLNKQAALPREGCPSILTAQAPCCGPGEEIPAMPEVKVARGEGDSQEPLPSLIRTDKNTQEDRA